MTNQAASRLAKHRILSRLRRVGRLTGYLSLLVVLLLGMAPASPVIAGGRKAKKLYKQGRKAEVARNYDRALELYELAAAQRANDPVYMLAVRRIRFVAGQAHIGSGRRLRLEGRFEEAAAEFQRALELDPASSVAEQERKRTIEMIEIRDRPGGSAEEAMLSPLERERLEREQRVSRLKGPPVLKPISSRRLKELTFRNQESKVIFETIGKLAGINVLFDSDYDDKKISIELLNATLHDALDYVSLLAKAYWKPLTDNAIFITNDTQNKRRDFGDEVVKTFYLTNAATPQELQEVATAVRGLTDIRRIFPVNSMNALIVRGPRDKMALAEKIIDDVDKARPEVIVDILVLETSKTSIRDLGLSLVSGGAGGIDIPVSFTGGGGSGGGVALSQLGNLSSRDWSTTLPGGIVQALMSRSDTRLLQSPRIRAADNFQASLRIGQRIPIATGSFGSGIGAGIGGGFPLVNTQFQYQEIGVNIDLTPKIHNNGEISMHIEVEVSNVADFIEIGGIRQPIFGQRRVAHDIRVKEGEATILGGLLQTQVFKTRSGLPILGDIPFLGRLFSTESEEISESEILIVLIPHIVRLPDIKQHNLRMVASGTEQVFRVRYEQEDNDESPLRTVGADAPGETSPTTAAEPGPAAPAPPAARAPAPATPAPVPAGPAPAATIEAPAAPAEPAQPASGPRLALQPAAPELTVGGQLEIQLLVQDVQQLFGMPMRIRYDQKVVKLIDIRKGTFLEGDEQDLIFSKNIRHVVGQAAVNISRFPGTGGLDGSGVIVTLVFEGLAAGTSNLRVVSSGARDGERKLLQVKSAQATLTVQ